MPFNAPVTARKAIGNIIDPEDIAKIQDAVQVLDGTFTGEEATAVQAAVARSESREYDVRAWGTPTGLGTDVTFINQAISDIYGLGGGTLVFPSVATGYGIDRVDSAPNPQLSGMLPRPGVNLHSAGATFHMRDNTSFLHAESEATATLAISGDVTQGDTTYTVSSTTGVAVGQRALVRLGTRAGDEAEPLWFGWGTVTTIGSGTITLDLPAGRAATVGSISEAHNKRIIVFDELIEDVAYTGTWHLVNDMTGSANAEVGLSLKYCHNVRMDNVRGVNVGAGAVATQFCAGIDIRSITVPECAAQGGHTAKGRACSFAESDGVHVGLVRIGQAVGGALGFVEHLSRGVLIDVLEFTNTEGDRGEDSIMHLAFGAQCHVGHLVARGFPGNIHSGDPGLTVGHLDIAWTAAPSGTGFGAQIVTDRITYNGTTYGPKQTVQVPIAIVPSMDGVIPFVTTTGIFAGLWVELADTTDVGGSGDWGIQSGTGAGTVNINPAALSPGVPTLITNSDTFGALGTYGASSVTLTKRVYIYTGSGVDPDNYAIFTYEIFPPLGEREQVPFTP